MNIENTINENNNPSDKIDESKETNSDIENDKLNIVNTKNTKNTNTTTTINESEYDKFSHIIYLLNRHFEHNKKITENIIELKIESIQMLEIQNKLEQILDCVQHNLEQEKLKNKLLERKIEAIEEIIDKYL